MLNELADDRAKILRRLFPGTPLFSVNAEQINDYLVGKTEASVVLMNPPFSSSPKISDRQSRRNKEPYQLSITKVMRRRAAGNNHC
jgi:hypothetical protein